MSSRINAMERAMEWVEQEIASRRLQPGDMLPSIEALARRLELSRSSAREALQRLAALRIIRIEHGSGTYVARPQPSDLLLPLHSYSLLEGLSAGELITARQEIQALTVRVALQVQDPADIERFAEEAIRRQSGSTDADAFLAAEREFHVGVARLTGNRFFTALVELLWELLYFALPRKYIVENRRAFVQSHRAILQAMRAGDAERAASLMQEHIAWLETRDDQTKDLVIYCDAFGTGSVGGSFYNTGQALSQLISKHTWIKPTVQATGGGIDNVRLADQGQFALAISQADVALAAFRGEDGFDTPHENIRLICTLESLQLQVAVRAQGPIRSIAELRGRRVAVGARGGASVNVAAVVLGEYGLRANEDITPLQLPLSSAVAMLAHGEVDAMFYLSAGQNATLLEFALEQGVRLLAIDQGVATAIARRHPNWSVTCIEPGTYPGLGDPITTVGVLTVMITHAGVAVEDVRAVTETIFTYGRRFGVRAHAEDLGIPYHEGATRYFLNPGTGRPPGPTSGGGEGGMRP